MRIVGNSGRATHDGVLDYVFALSSELFPVRKMYKYLG